MSPRTCMIAIVLSLPLLFGCGSQGEAEVASKAVGPNQIARIVMIDKAQCCDCTRRCIETCSIALEAALADLDIPLQRIHIDTEPDAVKEYRAKKPFMVLPALYFLDKTGGLVHMLQGQITEDQVRETLAGTPHVES